MADKNSIVISISIKNPGPYSQEQAMRLAERSLHMGQVIATMLEGESDRSVKVVGDYRHGEGYTIVLHEKDNHVEVRKTTTPPVRGDEEAPSA